MPPTQFLETDLLPGKFCTEATKMFTEKYKMPVSTEDDFPKKIKNSSDGDVSRWKSDLLYQKKKNEVYTKLRHKSRPPLS